MLSYALSKQLPLGERLLYCPHFRPLPFFVLQLTKGFSVFNQPVSSQVNSTMIGEEEKLLSRALRSTHLKEVMKANINKPTNGEEAGKDTPKEPCSVIGCTALRQAGKDMHHTYYDDTVSSTLLGKWPRFH